MKSVEQNSGSVRVENGVGSRRTWIYMFPALMDFGLASFMFFASVKASWFGVGPVMIGVLGAVWGLVYCVMGLVLSRFASRKNAFAFMVVGLLGNLLLSFLAGWSRSYLHLVWVLGFVAVSVSFFFIGFQLFMEEGSRLSLPKATAWYTLAWSGGLAFGSLTEGLFVSRGSLLALFPVCVSSLIILVLLFVVKRKAQRPAAAEQPVETIPAPVAERSLRRRYAIIGWISIVSAALVTQGMRFLLPEFALHDYGFNAQGVGVVLFLMMISQGVVGFVLGFFPGAIHRLAPHLWAKGAVFAGFLIVILFPGGAGMVLFAMFVGAYAGHGFFKGVLYALGYHEKGGRNVGINEALVGIAGVLGPLFFGTAIFFGRGLFYLLPVVILAMSAFVQLMVIRRAGRNSE